MKRRLHLGSLLILITFGDVLMRDCAGGPFNEDIVLGGPLMR